MRKKALTILLILAILLSLITALTELTGKTNFICPDNSCVKVQTSSFSRVVSIPIGFYAFILLGIGLYFHRKGKEEKLFLLLWAITGLEAYFMFLQFFCIRSFCSICLIFFALLSLCLIFIWRDIEGEKITRAKAGLFFGAFSFLVLHFVFFFPQVELNPGVLREDKPPARVELFASPSCSHCEEALRALKEICPNLNAALVVRPVSLSEADRKKALDWVCRYLFQSPSGTSRRLAEKIIWENEKEALNLNGGRLAVPLIVVKGEEGKQVFKGWDHRVRNQLESAVIESSRKIFSPFWPEKAEAEVCGGEKNCWEERRLKDD